MTNAVDMWFRIDGSFAKCKLEPLGQDLYRVVEVPDPFDHEYFAYRDVLRLRKAEDGGFDLVEIAERGGWRMFDYIISKQFAESTELAAVLKRVTQAQGVWARDLGGFLVILLPPDCIWNPERELDAAIKTCAARG